MPEFQERDPVDGLFADVSEAVAGYLRPTGVEMIYETVRRRRRNRLVAAGVLGLALVLGPAAGLALAHGPDDGKPPVADRTTAPPTPSPGPPTPPPTPSATATPAGGTGRISLSQLSRARLDIPAWPEGTDCVRDRVRIGDPASSTGPLHATFVGSPVYVDVDGDGDDETAVLIECRPQWADHKVMVFERDGDGTIVTVGQVVATGATAADATIKRIWAIRSAPDGDIGVDVGDYAPCCLTKPDLPQHQWRTFGWTGNGFTQTGGPTAFGPNPKVVDLVTTARAPTMTRQADGTYAGTVEVKIRNDGPTRATVNLILTGDYGLSATVRGRAGCRFGPLENGSYICAVGQLAVGATRTLRVDLTAAGPLSRTVTFDAQHGSDNRSYPDLDPDDNTVEVRIRAA
jgi:hypothetical protein